MKVRPIWIKFGTGYIQKIDSAVVSFDKISENHTLFNGVNESTPELCTFFARFG
jgi:hypothetical protein